MCNDILFRYEFFGALGSNRSLDFGFKNSKKVKCIL